MRLDRRSSSRGSDWSRAPNTITMTALRLPGAGKRGGDFRAVGQLREYAAVTPPKPKAPGQRTRYGIKVKCAASGSLSAAADR